MSRLAFVICAVWVAITLWVVIAMYCSYRLQLPTAQQIVAAPAPICDAATRCYTPAHRTPYERDKVRTLYRDSPIA